MADKATLLQKLPPVNQQSSSGTTSQSGSTAGTEVQAGKEISITGFQAVTYGSFVLTFILAGFAAVVLYRKAIGKIEKRIATSARVLAGVMALMAMHGFVATFLYTNYLRGATDSAPLSMTVLIWIILGITTGYVSNRLIELKDKLYTSDALIDGLFYAGVFAAVTVAVSPSVGPNAALLLSLLAIVLYVVPFSRFFIACKRIKFNRRGLKRKPGRSVLYILVTLPTLVPFFALLYVAELFGPDHTLLFFNAVALILICYISYAMLTRIKNELTEGADEAAAAGQPAKKAGTAKPEMDPLVSELLAEQEQEREQAPPPAKPADSQPSNEPAQPKPAPGKGKPPPKPQPPKPKPRKPSQNDGSSSGADDTPRVKPPSKPKKRF